MTFIGLVNGLGTKKEGIAARKVALENNRECTIIEIGPQYVEIAERRTAVIQQQLF